MAPQRPAVIMPRKTKCTKVKVGAAASHTGHNKKTLLIRLRFGSGSALAKRLAAQTADELHDDSATGKSEDANGADMSKEAVGGKIGKKFKKMNMTRLELDPSTGKVKLHILIAVRHVLTFPMLSIMWMAGQALELGIAKVEKRKREREGREKMRREESEKTKHKQQSAIIPIRSLSERDCNIVTHIANTGKRPRSEDNEHTLERSTKRLTIDTRATSTYLNPYRYTVSSVPLYSYDSGSSIVTTRLHRRYCDLAPQSSDAYWGRSGMGKYDEKGNDEEDERGEWRSGCLWSPYAFGRERDTYY